MEFSEKLKVIRQESNLTQEELAQKLFVSHQAISNYEQGKGYPSIDTLMDISNLFGVSLDELLNCTAKQRSAKYNLIALILFACSIFVAIICCFYIFKSNYESDIVNVIPLLPAINYVVPCISGIVGMLFQYRIPKMNYFFGYRTKASMKNPTLWNYAQVNFAVCILIMAMISLSVVNAFLIIGIFIPVKAFFIGCMIIICLQLANFIVPGVYVAIKLKKFV